MTNKLNLFLALKDAGLPIDSIDGNDVVHYTRALTAPEQTTANAVIALQAADRLKTQLRKQAKAILDATDNELADLLRAIVLADVDGHNNTRAWIRSFVAATAAASSLADLKTRVAALAPTPDFALPTVRGQIKSHLDTGEADS